jgi:hypothetical protein
MFKKSISAAAMRINKAFLGNQGMKALRFVAAISAIAALLVSAPAGASSGIIINDASTIQYAVQDGKVYLRNLNIYESDWLPCCYNYWIDLSTDTGKAMFSALLAHKLSGKRLTIYKVDPTAAGPIDILGDF